MKMYFNMNFLNMLIRNTVTFD